MKRKLTILLILLMSMVTSHAINTVKVKNVLVSQGGKANIVVELANSESVTAFTMKLFLCVICPKTAKGLNGLMKWTKKRVFEPEKRPNFAREKETA